MEMAEMYRDVVDLLRRPAVMETALDVLLCAVPIWVAVMIGLVIGWSWRPRWTGLVFLGLRSRCRFLWTAPPGFGARRLWFAFTALSAFSVCSRLWSHFKGKASAGDAGSGPDASAAGTASAAEEGGGISFSHLWSHFKGKAFTTDDGSNAMTTSRSTVTPSSMFTMEEGDGINFRSEPFEREQDIVSEKDLEHLLQLLDGKVGDAGWQHQMERSTPNMFYQAWRHEPEVGPIIYRSRTVFEDATPELLRDFFWDDDFRLKWDAMLGYYKTLEEFPQTGTMIVHWIKKFPFFCSDREYIIGRRIWESGKTYYCVTKVVPYPALPKNEKPRRVELYFSSWSIKAVESRKQDGQPSACEVTLVHYEDMGIPKDVAKVGIRHGMWGAVKKLQSGVRAYQHMRKTESPLSRGALMARITTRVPSHGALNLLDSESSDVDAPNTNPGVDWKWVVIGGTVAVVCGLQTGIIGKALLLGAARRLARK